MSEEVRFFVADDGGSTWSIAARDRAHAINILREQGATWEADADQGWVDLGIDMALETNLVELREMTPDEVARRQRCHTEDERGVIPLSNARLGDAFCSEW